MNRRRTYRRNLWATPPIIVWSSLTIIAVCVAVVVGITYGRGL